MLLKGFEIQSHQRTAHYLWPFRNGGLTYDAVGQIDPPSPGIRLTLFHAGSDITFPGRYVESLPTSSLGYINRLGCHTHPVSQQPEGIWLSRVVAACISATVWLLVCQQPCTSATTEFTHISGHQYANMSNLGNLCPSVCREFLQLTVCHYDCDCLVCCSTAVLTVF